MNKQITKVIPGVRAPEYLQTANMTGPEIVAALGGSNAPFSPFTRREGRVIDQGKVGTFHPRAKFDPDPDKDYRDIPPRVKFALDSLNSGYSSWRKQGDPRVLAGKSQQEDEAALSNRSVPAGEPKVVHLKPGMVFVNQRVFGF